jgi:hypothetical protein
MTRWCSVCRYEVAVEGFDLGARCLELGLEPDQAEIDFNDLFRDASGAIVTYPRWPTVEESELWARAGRSVEVVAWL